MGDRDYIHHEDEVVASATTAPVVTDPNANSQKQQQSSDGDGESTSSVLPKTQEEKDAFLRARMGIQMDLVKVKCARSRLARPCQVEISLSIDILTFCFFTFVTLHL